MASSKRSFALALAMSASALLGCAAAKQDELHVVPAGKTDNYYSGVASEYELVGSIDVKMSEQDFANPQHRDLLIGERLTAAGLYLTTYLTDKFRGIDSNNDGEISDDEVFFQNDEYGGFQAMVRNYSLETDDIENIAPDTYRVLFTVDVAGPRGMLGQIPGEAVPGTEGLRFSIQMPDGMTVSPGNVPGAPIRNFDPADFQGDLETLEFVATAHEEVSNSWPAYDAFMEDGVYDITMFFGHDYNAQRADLKGATEAFNFLQAEGFEMPAPSLGELRHDSGPATNTIYADGKAVDVEVRIYHSDMFQTERSLQHDLALEEIANRDVFFYNGHAGPYYGFYLDEAGAAKIDYKEFADYPFQADKQQLVIAQGCQTYSQYADMLYANPVKDESNLDVITTVNYSYGYGTLSILENLLQTGYSGNHVPVDFYRIIADLNASWINRYRDVFYGIMGIDGNETLHPYANSELIGEDCTSINDCGDPKGNFCLDPGTGSTQCGAMSLGAGGCPTGTEFFNVASGGTISAGACFKL